MNSIQQLFTEFGPLKGPPLCARNQYVVLIFESIHSQIFFSCVTVNKKALDTIGFMGSSVGETSPEKNRYLMVRERDFA